MDTLEIEKVTEQDPNKKAHSFEHDNLFVDQKLFNKADGAR